MFDPKELDTLWDYNDPEGSEKRFATYLDRFGGNADAIAEIQTQVARTLSLRRRFDESHKLLDEILKKCPEMDGRLAARYHLERGRTFNSSGEKDKACSEFNAALDSALAANEDFYAVDAAHMLGIVAEQGEREAWNRKAIEMATSSEDVRARNWRGSLLNNLGWTLHDLERFPEALECFEQALQARIEQGNEESVRIAEWCIARCYRSLGRFDEALDIQKKMASELADAGKSDGFCLKEVGECLLALGRNEEAKPYFAKAHVELSKDPWVVANEPEMLVRLKELSAS